MASSSRTRRAKSAVGSAADNPYLRRLMDDEELRKSIRNAFDAARDAYERMSSNGKGPINSAIDDKKVRNDLKVAAESLRDASERFRGRAKERRWGRLLLIAVAGAALALVLSEDLRKAILDKLFGAEEEFEYTSTTSASPAPEPAAAE